MVTSVVVGVGVGSGVAVGIGVTLGAGVGASVGARVGLHVPPMYSSLNSETPKLSSPQWPSASDVMPRVSVLAV